MRNILFVLFFIFLVNYSYAQQIQDTVIINSNQILKQPCLKCSTLVINFGINPSALEKPMHTQIYGIGFTTASIVCGILTAACYYSYVQDMKKLNNEATKNERTMFTGIGSLGASIFGILTCVTGGIGISLEINSSKQWKEYNKAQKLINRYHCCE
jgi:hypothetical protein